MSRATAALRDDIDAAARTPAAHAVIWMAMPLALFVAVAVEATRAPAAEDAPAFIGHGLVAAVTVLWAPLVASLAAAALVSVCRVIPRIAAIALVVALALAATWHCYRVTSGDEAFRLHPLFLAAFAALFVFLLASILAAVSASRGAPGLMRSAAPWAIALLGLSGFTLASVLNRDLFAGEYPTLHLGLVEASYLLLHAGLSATAWLLRARRLLIGALVTTAVLAIASIACSHTASGEADLAAFRNFTDLGRADAVEHPAPATFGSPGARPRRAASTTRAQRPDDAAARFERMSGLPALPPDFELDRYNLLLVSIDTTSCRDTSVCDPAHGATPHLAAFGRAHGYTFTRAYSTGSGTLSSMSSIMAMTYPSLAKLHMRTRWHGRLDDSETTAAEVLAAHGYRTFYAGHNYKGHFSAGGRIAGLHQGFSEKRFAPGGYAGMRDPTVDVWVQRTAIATIDAHRADHGRFFGWVFFESPHEPYLPRGGLSASSAPRALYRAEIEFADEQLHVLLSHLEQTGLLDATIVVIHGDHGEAFGEHGRRYHSDVYDEVTHVPLVVHIPGVSPARIDTPTSLVHVLPWLLARASPPLRAFAWQRLRDHIVPMLEATRGALVCELPFERYQRVSLIDATHRVVRDNASGYVELYDLRADPSQRRSVFDPNDATSRAYLERLAAYDALRSRIRGQIGLSGAM